jgi:FMN reductase
MAKNLMVVGIGGTARPGSSTEKALQVALTAAESAGAETLLFGARMLAVLPLYDPRTRARSAEAMALIEAVRAADGVIVASPGYHGAVAGLVKNALDYLEDLRHDELPYLTGRAVGCVATAAGWQAAVTTLMGIRTLVHALRGWPTPLGAAVNTTEVPLTSDHDSSTQALFQLREIGAQVVEFSRMRRAWLETGEHTDPGPFEEELMRDGAAAQEMDIVWISEKLCAWL